MVTVNRKIREFSDIDLLFGINDDTRDINKKLNEDAIKQSIKNLILTKNYERLFHPENGCQITSLLFENFDPTTISIMEQSIRNTINNLEPRARVLNVQIVDNSDLNAIDVTVEFIPTNSNSPVSITTTIERAR